MSASDFITYVLDHPGHEHHGKTVVLVSECAEADPKHQTLGRIVRIKGTRQTFQTTLWHMARPA